MKPETKAAFPSYYEYLDDPDNQIDYPHLVRVYDMDTQVYEPAVWALENLYPELIEDEDFIGELLAEADGISMQMLSKFKGREVTVWHVPRERASVFSDYTKLDHPKEFLESDPPMEAITDHPGTFLDQAWIQPWVAEIRLAHMEEKFAWMLTQFSSMSTGAHG